MEILNEFGFNTGLFLAQIVNFLILAFVFKKFLYKPILKVLEDRKKAIAKGIKESEEASAALASAEDERTKILQTASKESQKIIDETKKSAEEIRSQILESAQKDAEKMVAEAKKQSEMEMDRMRKEASDMSLQLSKSILERVITQLFSKSEQEILIKKGLQEIERNG
jgi:F-type H+-transporting ATPase subunit b